MVYPDNLCNAIQYSGATSDYMHMSAVNNTIAANSGYNSSIFGYGSYLPPPPGGGLFSNTNMNYTQNADGSISYNYSQKPDRLMLGIGGLTGILSGIGNIMIAKDQAEAQQQQQMLQYQAYQQQAAQIAQQQKQQQQQANMQNMFQMMMTMKMMEKQGVFSQGTEQDP